MNAEIVRILSQLIEVQLEQGQVANHIAFAQAQRAIAMHNYFVHDGQKGTAETDLERARSQSERNQERLRKLLEEVMKVTVSQIPTLGGGVGIPS